ncbi:MAG TPA: hypothetical protein VH877_06165 [Polyangia bacterium]|nr:hypothetical protein [Polyangia bacterium]
MTHNALRHLRHSLMAALTAALLPACQTATPAAGHDPAAVAPTDPTANQSLPHEHHLDVHWVTVDTFQDLVLQSDLIVRGRVVQQRTELQPGMPDVDKIPKMTVSTIVVDEIVSAQGKVTALGGDAVAPGSKIEVEELGGPLSCGCRLEPSDHPVLRSGGEAVFFLKNHRAGGYHAVGGYQGRFDVRDGRVKALGSDYHPHGGFDRYNQRLASDFTEEVRSLSARSPAR